MDDSDLMSFEMKNDILIARYNSNKAITKDLAKSLVESRKEFTKGQPVKMIICFPKLSSMDKGGRDYMSSDEAKEGVLASAMVTSSILGRVIVNFFLKLNYTDDVPNKVFNSEEEALAWLENLDLN